MITPLGHHGGFFGGLGGYSQGAAAAPAPARVSPLLFGIGRQAPEEIEEVYRRARRDALHGVLMDDDEVLL